MSKLKIIFCKNKNKASIDTLTGKVYIDIDFFKSNTLDILLFLDLCEIALLEKLIILTNKKTKPNENTKQKKTPNKAKK